MGDRNPYGLTIYPADWDCSGAAIDRAGVKPPPAAKSAVRSATDTPRARPLAARLAGVQSRDVSTDRGGLWGWFDDVHDFIDDGLKALGLFGAALTFVTIAITAVNPWTYAFAVAGAVAAAVGAGYYLYRTNENGSLVFKRCD